MKIDSPDSIALADSAAGQTAAYIHIPFCRKICPYCDFAVVAGTDLADRYVAALLAEIESADPFAEPLASVAFGGGTPTALGTDALEILLEAVESRFGFDPEVEVSLEANPEDISQATALALQEAGFGRVSLGVQSFDDSALASLGREHSAAQAIDATRVVRSVFDSVSVDLMFGTPGEDLESWRNSVTTALDLGVDHLSTYSLTVERGTPLSRAVAAGAPAPDPDLQADQWLIATELAQGAGLVRYETSNHARAGHAVIYNLVTWGQGEYAAFGNGAHRHRDGLRSWNVRRLERYIERIENSQSPVSGEERLGPWEREVERVLLGLRRAAGVLAGVAGERLLKSEQGSAVVDAGILEVDGDRLRIARPLLGDGVSRALLALTPGDC
jgi:putative oxygen-independent coproporphyrinogen III oxidase